MVPKIEPEYEFKKAKVKQALSCLRELQKKKLENAGKLNLFDQDKDEPVSLHVTMKKIPKLKSFQRIRVRLPYSFLKEDADVCLITRDLDKNDRKADCEETVLVYKDMLKRRDVNNVTEVVSLRQLRTEYQSFESKRQLAGQFDVFLSDRKIHECLSRLLGKTFIKRKKFPIQLDIFTKNLKQQVDQALSGTVFYVTGRGNSCGSQVAHLGLKDIEIIKNVRAVVKTLAARLPGGWKNIDTLSLQTTKSVTIPIYVSFEFQEEIEIKVPEPMEIDFLSSVNEYIREQEEDSFSDSEEETETKKIGKKRIKAEKDEESADEEFEDIQNKVPKPKKRKILPSVGEYIRKLREEYLSDDEKETKKVEKDSDRDSEESADEVEEKKIKGRKTKTRKIKDDYEANEESAHEVHEKSDLSTEKKIKGKKTKTKIVKREKVQNGEDEANEESADEVQKKSEFKFTGEKIKGKKLKTKNRKSVENDGDVQEKSKLRSTGTKKKKIGKRQKNIMKMIREEAMQINKDKNTNEKSIVTKQKKKKNVKISAT